MRHNETFLIIIEIIPGVFLEFNKIYAVPYFTITSQYKIIPHPPEISKKSLESHGIERVYLSNWSKDNLQFYKLCKLMDVTISDFTEKVNVLIRVLNLDPDRVKMFPLKTLNAFIAAIEQYSGAYQEFQAKTGLKPIEVRKQ